VEARSWLFLNQDTWASGLLCGGLQVSVTFSPLFTVRFVGCCTKLQSISETQHLKAQTSCIMYLLTVLTVLQLKRRKPKLCILGGFEKVSSLMQIHLFTADVGIQYQLEVGRLAVT